MNKTDEVQEALDKQAALRKLEELADEVVEETLELIKLKKAKKMWDEFTYQDLLEIPPKKKPCFLAGTLIHTIDGSKPIEQIELGEIILSYNLKQQIVENKTVTKLYKNSAEKYIEIYTSANDCIKATGQHRFFKADSKSWIAAVDLKAGMPLLNTHGKQISTVMVKTVVDTVDTYNLEIADNHTYYVGDAAVLTHNANKKLKFSSEVLYDFEFYEYYDYSNNPTYVGQTTQGLIKRADQHLQEYKRDSVKKAFVGKSQKLPKEIIINSVPGPYKMTAFEAAITEMHELNVRGGKRINNKGLYNKKNPVSKKSFYKYKQNPNFNPCRFYA